MSPMTSEHQAQGILMAPKFRAHVLETAWQLISIEVSGSEGESLIELEFHSWMLTSPGL